MFTIYSRHRAVRRRQLIGDGVVVLWCALWISIALKVQHTINELTHVGTFLQRSGADMSNFSGSSNSLLKTITSPLESVGGSLGNAGVSQVNSVHHVALVVALVIALGPTLPMVIRRIVIRAVWMFAENRLHSHHDRPGLESLLAQRALMRQPLSRLMRISLDPVADVAAGNHAPYAALELGRGHFPW